ncbi:MAG: hypothetical protein H6657_14610 [Ardenticatenaceae bacterium]|nr:hypothetical protein [Ardenticatenaceae bacterium]
MEFLSQWQEDITSSLEEFSNFAQDQRDLELTYGLVATGILWPIREKVQEFDIDAINAVKKIIPQQNNVLLRFLQHWSPNKLEAVQELASAAKQDINLQSALDQLLEFFDAMSVFLRLTINRYVPNQEKNTTYDIGGIIQGLLVNIGGTTTVQNLNVTIGSMVAGTANINSHSTITSEILLDSYLQWLITQHQTLELRGTKQLGGLAGVPLENVYVALRGDRSSPFERQKSHTLLEIELTELEEEVIQQELSHEERRILLWRALGRSPWMLSLEERDRPQLFRTEKSENLSLGAAFQKERWLAILGDPGSGKTTVARWLTLKFAQAMLNGDDRLLVPLSQVEPDQSSDEIVDMGPVRLPILLRISEFADARYENPNLLLSDFLGHHSWLGQIPTFGENNQELQGEKVPPSQLNILIKQYLKQGNAIILLDGLDEISAVDNRADVVRAVEQFIRDWVVSPIEKVRFNEFANLSPTAPSNYPSIRGGNQIIVTSRIAGYHAAPLSGQVAHFTIDPMSNAAVNRFCDNWMHAIFENKEIAARQSKALQAEIHNPDKPGVRELASNPLLLTVLALIFHNSEARLPSQRVTLYQMSVEHLTKVWRQRGHELNDGEVTYVLAHIAYFIHENYSTGLIEESEIRDQVSKSLASYRNIPFSNVPPSFIENVDNFIKILREEVGLIAARGEYLYGFLHLSFQEYFAALYLIQNQNDASKKIIDKMDKPRWREPLLLALGQISLIWPKTECDLLFEELLATNDDLSNLLPRSEILLASALGEMVRLPSKAIIQMIANKLIDTYSKQIQFAGFDLLYKTVEDAFSIIYRTNAASVVEIVLIQSLEKLLTDNFTGGYSAAKIIKTLKWYTVRTARALLHALPHDKGDWDWVINKSIIEIVKTKPELFPSYELYFRHRLLEDQELLTFVSGNLKILALINLLYGGILTDENVNDPEAIQFSPSHIYRNSTLSTIIIDSLEKRSYDDVIKKLESELKYIWHESTITLERVEALLALLTLGIPLESMISESKPLDSELIKTIVSYGDMKKGILQPMYLMSLGNIKREVARAAISERKRLDIIKQISLFERESGFSPSKVSLDFISSDYPMWTTNYWMEFVFSSDTEDVKYNLDVMLDTFGSRLSNTPEKLIKSLVLLQENYWENQYWHFDRFPPYIVNDPALELAELLNVVDGISSIFDSFRSWILEESAEVIKNEQPILVTEALAVALSINLLEFRQNVIRSLAPELLYVDNIHHMLFERATNISDELHKARSLWRLIQILPLKYYFDGLNEAIISADKITDPQEKSRMFWRLGNLLPTGQQKYDLYDKAYNAALIIINPNNKARALARLATVAQIPGEIILPQVLDEIEKVSEINQRSEILHKTRPLLVSMLELKTRLDSLVNQHNDIETSWKVRNSLLPLLKSFEPNEESIERWVPAYLIACLNESRVKFGIPTKEEEVWLTLVDQNRRGQALNQLLIIGVKHGLNFTLTVANILNTLIAEVSIDFLAPLLSLLQSPARSTKPLLFQWLQHEELFVREIASLLLLDLKYFSLDTVNYLLALLESKNDRLRYRVYFSLTMEHKQSINPVFKLSSVNTKTLEILEQVKIQKRQDSSLVYQSINWFFENLWIDDGNEFDKWIKLFEYFRGEEQLVYARLLLDSRAFISDVWTIFLQHLQNENEDTIRILLSSLIYTNKLSRQLLTWDDDTQLRVILRRLSQKGSNSVRMLALECFGFLHSLESSDIEYLKFTIDNGKNEKYSAQALIALGRRIKSDDVNLLKPYLKSTRIVLRNAADEAYVRLKVNRFISVASDEKLQELIDHMLQDIDQDPYRLLRSVLAAAQYRWMGNYSLNCSRLGAILVERFPILLDKVIEDFISKIETPHSFARADSVDKLLDNKWMSRTALFDVMTSVAERMPNAFASAVDPERIQAPLISFAKEGNVSERLDSMILLSYLRRVTNDVVIAIKTALNDVEYVQEKVLQSVLRFRHVDDDLLQELEEYLYDKSVAISYTITQLFQALGTTEKTSFENRQRIMNYLAKAIENPLSKREIYILQETDSKRVIKHIGTLNNVMYKALVNISGVSGRLPSLRETH